MEEPEMAAAFAEAEAEGEKSITLAKNSTKQSAK